MQKTGLHLSEYITSLRLNYTKQLLQDTAVPILSYKNYEIILIDNDSDDNNALIYFKQLADRKLVRLLRYDGIFNYSHINNIAVSEAKGDIVVLLNNDTEIITNN